jgi:hypothetical protein
MDKRNEKDKENPKPQMPEKGSPYEIPVEGSLGLLAVGYRGLVAWREKRKQKGYHHNQHLYIVNKKDKKDA